MLMQTHVIYIIYLAHRSRDCRSVQNVADDTLSFAFIIFLPVNQINFFKIIYISQIFIEPLEPFYL